VLPSPVSRENALPSAPSFGRQPRPAGALFYELGLPKALDRDPIEFARVNLPFREVAKGQFLGGAEIRGCGVHACAYADCSTACNPSPCIGPEQRCIA
jgi:hypothetical protein